MKKRLISITPPHTIAQTLNHQQQTHERTKQQNPTSSATAATAAAEFCFFFMKTFVLSQT
jgi:hypothetical protein